MARVLVIGDVHEPATHPAYLPFAQYLAERFDTDRTIFIGDVVDHHCASFHQANPTAAGPDAEADAAHAGIQRWAAVFERATVTIGNHDERVHRLAASVRVPPRFVQDYARVWDTPRWKWVTETTVDGVRYLHGTGLGGQAPALSAAVRSMRSTVCGHVHSVAGTRWACGPGARRVFGMDTGCGVDDEHPAMGYGRDLVRRPVLGAGVVLDGEPLHLAMDHGPRGRWNRRRFRGGDS